MGFCGESVVKNLPASAGDPIQSLVQEMIPGEGNVYPLQYSCLGNAMDRGALQATVHGLAKSQTRPSDFHFQDP